MKILFYAVSSAFSDPHQAQPSFFMGPSWSTSDRFVHSYFKSSSTCHYQHRSHYRHHYFYQYYRHAVNQKDLF